MFNRAVKIMEMSRIGFTDVDDILTSDESEEEKGKMKPVALNTGDKSCDMLHTSQPEDEFIPGELEAASDNIEDNNILLFSCNLCTDKKLRCQEDVDKHVASKLHQKRIKNLRKVSRTAEEIEHLKRRNMLKKKRRKDKAKNL